MQKKSYHSREEKFNVLSHLLGVILSLVGTVYLVSLSQSTAHLVSYLIYGVSGFILYLMSTLYHNAKKERVRKILKICDHSAIYVFIAGCYTPFLVLNIASKEAYILLACVWFLTFVGIIFKVFFTGRFQKISTLVYLLMGWLVVTQGNSLLEFLTFETLLWLVLGGFCYSFGAFFYLWHRFPFNHGVWHVFVILGSVSHYIALLAGFSIV